MSMMHKRDKPTYFQLIDSVGRVVETMVPKSKVLRRKVELEKDYGKLTIVEMRQ